ncbi:MAG: restriction endonuclease subunit S [Clostridia bacterium]|nr:restriction endonuclease subunit S [Clostridia bacterium]
MPIGWTWGRLQSFCFPISDGTHQTPTYTDEGFIFLSAKNVTSWKIDWNNVMHIPESLHNELSNRISPKKNDILLAKNGTIGVAAIVDRDCDFDIYVTLAVLRTINTSILPQYLLNAIASSTVQNEFRGSLKGIGVQNLHLEHIRRTLIPIPPYNEQKLISDKVVEITPLLEHIADTYTELETAISVLKAKILDLAIRGKLVSQNPEDEPASVLLDRIRAEKEELIRHGKIKRDKKESIIFKGEDNSYYRIYEKFNDGTVKCIEDEIPCELPQGWVWCRLNMLSDSSPNSFVDGPFGSNLKTEHYTHNREVRIIQLNNIGEFIWRNNGVKYTTFQHAETLDRCITYPEDIVIAKMMPAGRAIIVPHVESIYVISSDCVRLRVHKQIYNRYLMFAINSSVVNEQIQDSVHGIGRSRTSLSKCKELLIPIPPLKEQFRIVESIETSFAQLEAITNSLN